LFRIGAPRIFGRLLGILIRPFRAILLVVISIPLIAVIRSICGSEPPCRAMRVQLWQVGHIGDAACLSARSPCERTSRCLRAWQDITDGLQEHAHAQLRRMSLHWFCGPKLYSLCVTHLQTASLSPTQECPVARARPGKYSITLVAVPNHISMSKLDFPSLA
jgi:hypothetical protein